MRFTIDGLSLHKWCLTNDRNYQNARNRILSALGITKEKFKELRKPKKTYEKIKTQVRINNRIKLGYSQEEALLDKDEFNKVSATRYGTYKIGKYNLMYVCKQLGVNYNTVYIMCIKRKRMTPREYLESKGYDLTQFEE